MMLMFLLGFGLGIWLAIILEYLLSREKWGILLTSTELEKGFEKELKHNEQGD